MSLSYRIDHTIYILRTLDLYKLTTIFLHSRESMEILDEVLASLHHPMSSLHLPKEFTMFYHGREDLIECRSIVFGKKTPRVTERCTTNHKSVEIFEACRMYHLHYTIFIVHYIAVADHRDTDMLFEVIYPSEISTTCECLFISPPMYGYQIGSCPFESLHKVDEEIRIFPSKASFHGYRYFHGFTHFLYDPKCGISVDHE